MYDNDESDNDKSDKIASNNDESDKCCAMFQYELWL